MHPRFVPLPSKSWVRRLPDHLPCLLLYNLFGVALLVFGHYSQYIFSHLQMYALSFLLVLVGIHQIRILLGHFSWARCLIQPFQPGSMSQWQRGHRLAMARALAVRHSFIFVWVLNSLVGMASLHFGHRLQYLCCSHSLSRWLLRLLTSMAWLHSLQRFIIGQEEQRCLSRKLSSQNRLSNCLQQSQKYYGFWACFLGLGYGFALICLAGLFQTTTFQMTPPSSSIFDSIILTICGFRCYISGQRFSYPIYLLILAISCTAAIRISLFLSQRNLLQNQRMIFLDRPIVYLVIMRVSIFSLPIVILGSFSLREPFDESVRMSQQSYLFVRLCAGRENMTSQHVYRSFQLLWPKQSVSFCRIY